MLTARTSRQEIREAIQASGRTQEEAAAAIGISPVTLSRWLNGHADPAFDKLDLLAAAIGQPIVLTFGRHTKEPPPEWATVMHADVLTAIAEAGLTSRERSALRALDATARPTSEADDDPPETEPPARAHGQPRTSPRGR